MRKTALFTLFCLMLFFAPVFAEEEKVCVRDSFFPENGNCGYDVERYDLRFTWTAEDDRWQGDETITLFSEWDQDELRLDFDEAMTITELTVNGSPAPFALKGSKLTLFCSFSHDTRYEIHARFSGRTPRGTVFGKDETPEGSRKSGLIVENEPIYTGHFFICNDTPRDKALMSITMTVPGDFVPICGGRLTEIIETDGTVLYPSADLTRLYENVVSEGTVTYRYEYAELLAPYLAAFSIGKFDLYSVALPDGRIQLDAIDSTLEPEAYGNARKLAGLSAEMIAYFGSLLGDYPFRDSGSIIFSQESYSAIETQTRPTYDGKMIKETVFAHEIAHQWIGDHVAISDWSDVWMKEGFAAFAEALWEKHLRGEEAFECTIRTYYEMVAALGKTEGFAVELPVGPMGITKADVDSDITAMYRINTYYGGMMVYAVLYRELGEEQFFEAMRLLISRKGNSYADHQDLIDAFAEVSGRDIESFIAPWLIYEGHIPDW